MITHQNSLSINGEDYIHFQWTGSDYNINNTPNDGIGGPPDPLTTNGVAYRADRSNILQSSGSSLNYPRNANAVSMFLTPQGTPDYNLINSLAFINQPGLTSTNTSIQCLNLTSLLTKTGGNRDNADLDPQNCMTLSNAPTPYFDAGLVQMRASGRFTFFSSRNNDFSNRSQKGLLVVNGGDFSSATALVLNFVLVIACLFFNL